MAIIFLIAVLIIFGLYVRISRDIKGVWNSIFGSRTLKQVINEQEIEFQNTPKTLFGMENSYKNVIEKDFPDLNINELKSMAENYIIKYLNAIETKDKNKFEFVSDKVNAIIESNINDLKDSTVKYDEITIHKTVLNSYEKNNNIATIKLQTAFEYMYKLNNDEYKKIQDRYATEFVYIIDAGQTSSNTIGLNCPNCGAPIKSVGEKFCVFCGSGIKDIVKKTWVLNNISKF